MDLSVMHRNGKENSSLVCLIFSLDLLLKTFSPSQVMPFCYDGTNDMFEAQAWDMDQYTKDCQQTWGVTPRWGCLKESDNLNIGSMDIHGVLFAWSSP